MTSVRKVKKKRVSELETKVYEIRFMVDYDGEIYIMKDVETGQIALPYNEKVYKITTKSKIKMDAETGELHIFIPRYMNIGTAESIKKNLFKYGKTFMNAKELLTDEHIDIKFRDIAYLYLIDLVNEILYLGKGKRDYYCKGNIVQERKLLDFCEEIEKYSIKRREEISDIISRGKVEFIKHEDEDKE